MRHRRFYALLLMVSLAGPVAGQHEARHVERILKRYTDKFERAREADGLSSVSYEGTVEQAGETHRFVLRKKRPNSIRYRLETPGGSVICGYNGREGWKRIETEAGVDIGPLAPAALELLRQEANFESPLFRHLEKPDVRIKLSGTERVGEANCHVLLAFKRGEPIFRYFLEIETSRLLRRDQIGPEGETELETYYRDYREVDGFPFAFEVENRVDGEVRSRTRIDSVRVNPGILSFYFEIPEE